MARRSGHRLADKDKRKTGDPGPSAAMARLARNELALRVVSSAVLVPLAVGVAYLGGWPFLVFWAIAACGIFWEWRAILRDPGPSPKGLGECAIAVAGASMMIGRFAAAAMFLGLGVVVEAVIATTTMFRLWAAAGVIYAGSMLVACVLLRSDVQLGVVAIVLLFAVVWTTDILAYFVGR